MDHQSKTHKVTIDRKNPIKLKINFFLTHEDYIYYKHNKPQSSIIEIGEI